MHPSSSECGGEEAEERALQPCEEAYPAALLRSLLLRHPEGILEIGLHIPDYASMVEKDGQLEMQVEGPVVHVGRADYRDIVIGKEHLRMEEAGDELIDLHSRLEKRHIVRAGDLEYRLLVRDMRHQYADIDP